MHFALHFTIIGTDIDGEDAAAEEQIEDPAIFINTSADYFKK